jgi:hypothetical protein
MQISGAMPYNGPAIEFVSVAERLETESMINLLEAGFVRGRKERSMAHFLPSRYNYD